MKYKKQKMYLLHPGDLKRYRKEKDFKWEDIRKIAYCPKEIAEQTEEEKYLQKKTKESKIDIDEQLLEMSEEELKKMIDEYLTDDRIFEKAKKIINQRKAQRLVINLPGWLKEQLKQKSIQTGTSMNALVRLALTQYLSKEE
jgi:hypothetical protein